MYGKGLKGKATRLHAATVRARGACERCGAATNLQCAHIVSRRYSATRCDLTNAWCLCAGCHLELTHDPFKHVQFAIETRGDDGYAALRHAASSNARPWKDADWQNAIDTLTRHAEENGLVL